MLLLWILLNMNEMIVKMIFNMYKNIEKNWKIMNKKIIKSFVIMLVFTISILALAGCSNNPEEKHSESKFDSMSKIDDIQIEALYEGGHHDTYYVKEENIRKLEEIADSITVSEIKEGQVPDDYLGLISIVVECKDGNWYEFILGKGKIFTKGIWNNNIFETYSLGGDNLYKWLDEVMLDCENTDSTITRDWFDR